MKGLLYLAAAIIPSAALAVSLYSVDASTAPGRIYVGQPFDVILEIASDQNAEISAALPSGIDGDIEFEPPRRVSVKSRTRDDGTSEFVHTLAFRGVASAPVTNRISASRTTVSVTERVSTGFGSSMFTRSGVAPVAWKPFEILPLPSEGRPEGFAGAVGNFTLRMTASPSSVAPGDIVRLDVEVSGSGTLGEARPALPELPASLFKTYPPEDLEPSDGVLAAVSASVVPLSTQAVEIASATLECFDASSGAYRTVRSNPVRLAVVESKAVAVPAVRTLDLSGGKSAAEDESSGMVQLYLAPAETALRTFIVPNSERTVVQEETPDGRWRRVKILSTGATGWERRSEAK